MRDILFRGKPKYESDYYCFFQNWKDFCLDGFVFGSLVISNERYYICVSGICQVNTYINNGITSMIEVIPETVGQFTELTAYWETQDETYESKVFEHDVLKVNYEGTDVLAEVKYERGICILCSYEFPDSYVQLFDYVRLEDECWLDASVVGNVHNNSDLKEKVR